MEIEYNLKRSNRKSVSLSVDSQGRVNVRAPLFLPKRSIDSFVKSNETWIAERREKISKIAAISPEREKQLRAEAAALLPGLTDSYAAKMGVRPAYVKITGAATRFGSCNAKNGICYSWRLMLYPREAIEYVVVHELAHIRQKNHSAAFYAEIARVMPDYKLRRALLKNL